MRWLISISMDGWVLLPLHLQTPERTLRKGSGFVQGIGLLHVVSSVPILASPKTLDQWHNLSWNSNAFLWKSLPHPQWTLIVLVVEVDHYNTFYTSLNHQSNQKSLHSHRQKSDTQTHTHTYTHTHTHIHTHACTHTDYVNGVCKF